jgi:hypothetical protein
MKIANAPWNEIAVRMGDEATEADANRMIELLNARGIEDTDDVSDDEWFALVSEAIA